MFISHVSQEKDEFRHLYVFISVISVMCVWDLDLGWYINRAIATTKSRLERKLSGQGHVLHNHENWGSDPSIFVTGFSPAMTYNSSYIISHILFWALFVHR